MIVSRIFFLLYLKNFVSSYYLITKQDDKLQCVTNEYRYLYFYGETKNDTFNISTRFDKQISVFANTEKIIVMNLTEINPEWTLIHSTKGPVLQVIADKRWETLPTKHIGYPKYTTDQNSSDQTIDSYFIYNNSGPNWIYCLSSYNVSNSSMLFNNPTWFLHKFENNTIGPISINDPRHTAICKLPEYSYYFTRNKNNGEECFKASGECISMLVAVCTCCTLQINFKYNTHKDTFEVTHHNKWQRIHEILQENETNICFTKRANNSCTNIYFAIDDFRNCKKYESQILQQANSKLTKCAIDSESRNNLEIKNRSIDDSVNCSNNGLGPECISCSELSLNNNCSAMKICNITTCSCSPGYIGESCSEKCPSGSYGYYCKKKCDYCLRQLCNHVDGKCSIENYYYFGFLLLIIPIPVLVFIFKKYFMKKRSRRQLLLDKQLIDSSQLDIFENVTTASRRNSKKKNDNVILLKDFNKFVQKKTLADFNKLFHEMNLKEIVNQPQNESEIILDNNAAYFELTCARYINSPTMNKAYIIVQPRRKYKPITFWKLIWQEKVGHVVWLNDIDNTKTVTKTAKYWPNSDRTLTFENMSIAKVSMKSGNEYDCIKYRIQKKNIQRKIIQFFVKNWFTHIPMCSQFLNKLLITLLKKPQEAKSPVLVFVQPNDIEKANVIVLTDICLRTAAEKGFIDIKSSILQLRNFFPNAIEFTHDFELLHSLIADVLVNLNREPILKKELLQNNPKNILKNNFIQLQIQCLHDWFKGEKKTVFSQLRSTLQNVSEQQENQQKPFDSLKAFFAHGYKKTQKYMVIPQPDVKALSTFWKLISNFNISLVVYLHKPTSKNNKLFPNAKNSWILTCDSIRVNYVSSDEMCDFITNQYTVEDINSQKTICVEVIYLKMWLTHEFVPSNKRAFIDVLNKISQKSITTKHTLLSCPDGITASGLFVIASYLIQKLSVDNSVDVFKSISCLSQENRLIAYIKDQLEFLYEIAITHSYNNNS